MEISAISANLIPGGGAGQAAALAESAASILPVRPSDNEERVLPRPEQGIARRSERALEIFRQELKLELFAQLGLRFAARQSVYDAVRSALTSDDVAADALAAASRLVAENPDLGTRALVTFRQKVQAAAAYTQETVGRDDDIEDLDDALGQVNEGLDELDDEASRNVQSSASILSVDARLRQRSTIRIRTQEGDIVRLDVRRSERLSAEDIAVSNDSGFAARTEIAVSSRSRFTLNVRGDLNEAEFAAVQGVFAQAEAIADEFFGGDLSAAFGLASSLEFDSGQLARVNLRFLSRETINTTFAEITEARTQPVVDANPPIAARVVQPAAKPTADVTPVLDVTPPAVETEAQGENIVTHVPPTDEPASEASQIAFSDTPFLKFFELLADFLRSVAQGFELLEGGSTFRYHYSESFKMQILKSVIELAAPGESVDAAGLASTLIDGIVDAGEAEAADG